MRLLRTFHPNPDPNLIPDAGVRGARGGYSVLLIGGGEGVCHDPGLALTLIAIQGTLTLTVPSLFSHVLDDSTNNDNPHDSDPNLMPSSTATIHVTLTLN